MKPNSQLRVWPYVALFLIATSFVVGCSIPAFYDWTGADQSRSTPIVGYTAIGLLVIAFIACVALSRLPLAAHDTSLEEGGKFQFNISSILLITAGFAVFMTLLPTWMLQVLSAAAYVAACLYAIRSGIRFRSSRWGVISLVACMYLPFAWTMSKFAIFVEGFSALGMIVGLPMLLPPLFIGNLLQRNSEQMTWLCPLLAGLEVVVGVWFIHRGQRLAIAYQLFALILSTYGSFILNALLRM